VAVRIFLALSTLVWLPYGAYCFLHPAYLDQAAGVASQTATGMTEIRAMYGGLQIGIGLLALAGLLRDGFRRHALVTLAFLCGGLCTTRLAGAFLDGGFSSYTTGALVFEIGSTALALWLLRSTAPAPA
jgi:hypothetical protein